MSYLHGNFYPSISRVLLSQRGSLAHRLRDMQTLPYAIVTNPHMSHVYELYYQAFDEFRKVRPVRSVEDNEKYCQLVKKLLHQHLTIIPRLAMGVLECRDLMPAEEIDKFIYDLLRSVSYEHL